MSKTPMPMQQCESAAFSSHGYDPAKQMLALQFKSSGIIYTYPEVGVDLAESRHKAPSLGKWYSEHIKGQFTGTPWHPPKDDADEPVA